MPGSTETGQSLAEPAANVGWGSRHWFAAMVPLLGTLVGFYVSVYSTEIKEALKAAVGLGTASAWVHLAVAVVGTALFGLALNALLSAQQAQAREAERLAQAQRADTRKAQEFADEQSRVLRQKLDEVLSIPPQGFMKSFQAFTTVIGLQALSRGADPNLFDDRVRNILHAVASLAHQYDGAPASAAYSACLFLHHDQSDLEQLPEAKRKLLSQTLQLTDNAAAGLNGLGGVLELRGDMSVTVQEGKLVPDARVPAVTLGLPLLKKTAEGLWRAMPGAPWAAVTRQYGVWASLDDAKNWLDTCGDFTRELKSRFKAFFATGGAGQGIQSFAAIPLLLEAPGRAEGAEPEVLGVLTLHATVPGLLQSSTPRPHVAEEVFLPLLQPFLTALIAEVAHASRQAPDSTPPATAPISQR